MIGERYYDSENPKSPTHGSEGASRVAVTEHRRDDAEHGEHGAKVLPLPRLLGLKGEACRVLYDALGASGRAGNEEKLVHRDDELERDGVEQ